VSTSIDASAIQRSHNLPTQAPLGIVAAARSLTVVGE
jgi:hypothetical protein